MKIKLILLSVILFTCACGNIIHEVSSRDENKNPYNESEDEPVVIIGLTAVQTIYFDINEPAKTIQIVNPFNFSLTVESIWIDSQFFYIDDSDTMETVNPGESIVFTVTFNYNTAGISIAEITVTITEISDILIKIQGSGAL